MEKNTKNMEKTNKPRQFPRIGMRIIKSAIGVFICFLIDYFRGSSGILFYSLLAVLWCVRDYVSETKTFAIQRSVGTVIGALYGLIVLIAFGNKPYFNNAIAYGFIISISIIVILYTTVLFGQKQASYFSCVVFLSIVINHAFDVNPYIFVLNRFLDTMIGIAVGLCVNCFSLHRYRHKDILFISGLDDTLLAPGGEISAYSRVEINRMIERGVHFTVSTIRTPASLLEPLRGMKLTLPVISMDGAALYNISDNSYEKVYIISGEQSTKLQENLDTMGLDYFVNVVIEDVLLIYYKDSDNKYYNELMNKMKKSPYRNYIKSEGRVEQSVVYFMIIDTKDVILELYDKISKDASFSEFKVTMTKSFNMKGCYLIKIYNKNATKENMLDYLKNKLNIEKTVTFGTIKDRYDHVIEEGDFNRVVKLMKKDLSVK